MLMLMKIKSKNKHKVRNHDKINSNKKTKHGKHYDKTKKKSCASKSKGGSVFTAMRWFS